MDVIGHRSLRKPRDRKRVQCNAPNPIFRTKGNSVIPVKKKKKLFTWSLAESAILREKKRPIPNLVCVVSYPDSMVEKKWAPATR